MRITMWSDVNHWAIHFRVMWWRGYATIYFQLIVNMFPRFRLKPCCSLRVFLALGQLHQFSWRRSPRNRKRKSTWYIRYLRVRRRIVLAFALNVQRVRFVHLGDSQPCAAILTNGLMSSRALQSSLEKELVINSRDSGSNIAAVSECFSLLIHCTSFRGEGVQGIAREVDVVHSLLARAEKNGSDVRFKHSTSSLHPSGRYPTLRGINSRMAS